MSWEYVKFCELFDYENKSKIKAGNGLPQGKYPFYTSSNELSKYLNDYLFDKSSLIFGTGGNASIHYCNNPFSVSTDCLVAVPKDKNKVEPKFVFYYLFGNINLLENGFKGAGLKHISKSYINEILIPLPPLATQKRIAKILDDADALKLKDQQLLKKYDELTQAIFIEMFVDQAKNNNDFKDVKIHNLISANKNSIRSGPFGSDLLHSEFVDNGIAVLGIDNVVNNKFDQGKPRFITEVKFKQLSRYQVFQNDVLITIMGTVGRSCVVPPGIGLAINSKHLVAISLNKEIIDPHFFSYSITKNKFILNQIKKKSKGAIMDGLNIGVIKDLDFILPPLFLQKKFIQILTNILFQKNQTILNNSGILSNSLIQKAFNGELVN